MLEWSAGGVQRALFSEERIGGFYFCPMGGCLLEFHKETSISDGIMDVSTLAMFSVFSVAYFNTVGR